MFLAHQGIDPESFRAGVANGAYGALAAHMAHCPEVLSLAIRTFHLTHVLFPDLHPYHSG